MSHPRPTPSQAEVLAVLYSDGVVENDHFGGVRLRKGDGAPAPEADRLTWNTVGSLVKTGWIERTTVGSLEARLVAFRSEYRITEAGRQIYDRNRL